MKVKIKRLDKSIPLPIYQTKGSVGFDISAREDTIVPPKSVGIIPGNIIVETPPGYMLLLALRSSTPRKKGLHKPHGIGVIDNDYRGEKDEIGIQVFNSTDSEVKVEKGERIGQGIFVKVDKFEWDEVEQMGESRGGFGSTG
ncbi:dUTPase [Candidatus Woesearchaeota archaeon]|nr:dUTPase [Candidatus Woesearchaeota archaeon]|tara:strand:+ start:171 stop:596 length:426 start_codon:yes stop_codon:yes gene_type:complete